MLYPNPHSIVAYERTEPPVMAGWYAETKPYRGLGGYGHTREEAVERCKRLMDILGVCREA